LRKHRFETGAQLPPMIKMMLPRNHREPTRGLQQESLCDWIKDTALLGSVSVRTQFTTTILEKAQIRNCPVTPTTPEGR
jgi:hypothetical protein